MIIPNVVASKAVIVWNKIQRYPATVIIAGIISLLCFYMNSIFTLLPIIFAFVLLCAPLERWLGSKKTWQVLCSTGLFALLTGCGMMLYAHTKIPNLANGIYVVCLLGGITFSLAFTGGDKTDETFHLRTLAVIFPIALLLGTYCYIVYGSYKPIPVPAPDQFFFLYCLSIGVFGGMYFSWQNQIITNHGVFDKTRVLPPRKRIKWKQIPGTLCLLSAMAAISLVGVVTVPRQHLIDLYGSAGVGTWCRYVFLSYFQWDQEHIGKWMSVSLETLAKGQLWRPFTASLVHFGPLHLLGNGLVVYFAGKYMEPRVGTFRWLCVFFGSVWAAMLPNMLFFPSSLTGGGASVGTYALAAVFLLYSFKKDNPILSRPFEMIYLVGYIFIGNFIAFTVGHFVSFVFGLMAAFVLQKSADRG